MGMGEHVRYGTAEQRRFGYLSLPPAGIGPGLIVLQEWWGLVGHITAAADRLAATGYVVLAPDLYRGAVAADDDAARKLSLGLAMDQAAAEVADAIAFLGTHADRGAGTGILGFGMGGSLALWSGALLDELGAVVACYPPRASMARRWDRYANKVAMIHAAEGDGGSTAPGVAEAVASISTAGGKVEVYDYPGTHHAFCNEEQPEFFDPDAAELVWSRTIEFFDRYARMPV